MLAAAGTRAGHLPLRPHCVLCQRRAKHARLNVGDGAQDLGPVATNLLFAAKRARWVEWRFEPVIVGEARHNTLEIVCIGDLQQALEGGHQIWEGARHGWAFRNGIGRR